MAFFGECPDRFNFCFHVERVYLAFLLFRDNVPDA
jgi:hypothetical protein